MIDYNFINDEFKDFKVLEENEDFKIGKINNRYAVLYYKSDVDELWNGYIYFYKRPSYELALLGQKAVEIILKLETYKKRYVTYYMKESTTVEKILESNLSNKEKIEEIYDVVVRGREWRTRKVKIYYNSIEIGELDTTLSYEGTRSNAICLLEEIAEDEGPRFSFCIRSSL